MSKKQLEPLIPEERFGKMVTAITLVPKAKIKKAKPKAKRRKAKP